MQKQGAGDRYSDSRIFLSALTIAPNGSVTLANVPPGEYVVAVWQEKLGTKEQRIKLEPRGSVSVQFGYAGAN